MFRFEPRDSLPCSKVTPSAATQRSLHHPDLIALLEAEPAVDGYAIRPDGLVDVRYWGGRLLVGTLPPSGAERLRMEALKHERQREGRRVVLVPEARLARRPFRDNRRLVAAATGSPLAADARIRVLDAVDETGSAALGDLVRMLGTSDAAAGILALVGDGTLRVDFAKPIDANSVLHRFQPIG